MIMIIIHQSELREQLSESLKIAGHTVNIPPHRQDMLTMRVARKLAATCLQRKHPPICIQSGLKRDGASL
jgi:hypothetical protein